MTNKEPGKRLSRSKALKLPKVVDKDMGKVNSVLIVFYKSGFRNSTG